MKAEVFTGKVGGSIWGSLAAGLGLLLHPAAAHGITLELTSPSPSVLLGEQVIIDVQIHELDLVTLGAYDLEVAFDATVLQLSTVTAGMQMSDGVLFTSSEAAPGLLKLSDILFTEKPQPDSFDLVSLTFDAISTGTSAVTATPGVGKLNDLVGDPVEPDPGESLNVTVSASTTSVPEPSLGLFSLAILLGMARFSAQDKHP